MSMSLTRTILAAHLVVASLSALAGCSRSAPTTVTSGPSVEGRAYLLASEPSDAQGVTAARADVSHADEVAVFGRIGGDPSPWVAGQAAFLLVDSDLTPCNERDGDACPTPWDYCCDLDVLPTHKAMVRIVDADGRTVPTDARKLLGVQELQAVVVRGKALRDEAGNLTVLAEGVFVRP